MADEEFRDIVLDIFERMRGLQQEVMELGYIPTGILDAPAKVKKTVLSLTQQTTAMWQRGERVQRKQVLEILPLLWKLDGIDIDTEPPEYPQEMLSSEWPNHEAVRDMVAKHLLVAMRGQPFTPKEVYANFYIATMPVWSVWVYMRSRELSEPNVFTVSDSLLEKLMNTEIDNIQPEDIRLPLPGMYISLPPGVAFLRHQKTGFHELSLVGTGSGFNPIEGRSFFSVFYGEPNERSKDVSDDATQVLETVLGDGSGPEYLQSLLEGRIEAGRKHMQDIGVRSKVERDYLELYGERFDLADAKMLLHRLIVNVVFYLNTQQRDVEPAKSGQPKLIDVIQGHAKPRRTKVRISKRRATGRKKHEQRRTPQHYEWITGAKVKRLQRTMTAQDILVKGYNRMQPYGPGRKYRKKIWVEPYIRRPSDGEELPPGHDYELDSNA